MQWNKTRVRNLLIIIIAGAVAAVVAIMVRSYRYGTAHPESRDENVLTYLFSSDDEEEEEQDALSDDEESEEVSESGIAYVGLADVKEILGEDKYSVFIADLESYFDENDFSVAAVSMASDEIDVSSTQLECYLQTDTEKLLDAYYIYDTDMGYFIQIDDDELPEDNSDNSSDNIDTADNTEKKSDSDSSGTNESSSSETESSVSSAESTDNNSESQNESAESFESSSNDSTDSSSASSSSGSSSDSSDSSSSGSDSKTQSKTVTTNYYIVNDIKFYDTNFLDKSEEGVSMSNTAMKRFCSALKNYWIDHGKKEYPICKTTTPVLNGDETTMTVKVKYGNTKLKAVLDMSTVEWTIKKV